MEEQEIKQEEENLTANGEIKTEEDKKKKVKEKRKRVDKEKEELKAANLELKEKVLRITAEMQNMRRRYESDIANIYKYEGIDIVEKILPVLDNFERAMNVKTEGMEKYLDGFKMIYENLLSILKEKGIHEIDALNKEFDPAIMNAVMTEVNTEVDDNIVLDVLQKGYMYNDKLIRPVMVKVSTKDV